MSVPNQTPYIIYNANGLTTVFPFEFYIINSGDIQVTLNGEVVTSGYSVSGVGNVSGGDVIFLTPPASGTVVMLERVVPTYRLTDYQDNGDLLADTVNKDFDRLWMAIQRSSIYLGLALRRPLFGGPFNAEGYRIEKLADPVNDQDAATKKYVETVSLARTLRVPESTIGLVPSASVRSNKLLAFNNSGDPITVLPESGSAADVMVLLASDDGYKYIPSIQRINSEVPVEMFRSPGMTDQQIVQAANDYAASVGRRLIFEAGITYQVVTLNCTCEWSGPGVIKRKAGASSTLINMASGARITRGMTIDGNRANCTGSASNVVMNGVSDCLLSDFYSINACGHNIEINNSVYSDTRLPNKVKNGVVNGTTIGHAISLYNAANEVLEDLELLGCGDGVNASGSTRSIRPLVLRNVNARKNRGNGFALNFISTADTPVYDMAKLSDCFARENGLNGFAIQSHYTSLTNCHAYRNGTTKDHQGFLFNADGITFNSLISFENKGVGADFGDCRKCAGAGLFAESNEWHGLEINSCEEMAFSSVVLNNNFKGQVDGALQAALIIHKGNGGYPFPGDSKNISLSAVTIGSGEGQRYAVYVDADSYNVTIDGVACKTAALLDDIVTASPNVRIRGQVTRWDPMGLARASISSNVIGIPSVADTVQVNGTGSVVTINILNGGTYIKDRYVRIMSVNGMTLENSGGSGGNLYLGSSIVLGAGDSVRLWSDGSGGWKRA